MVFIRMGVKNTFAGHLKAVCQKEEGVCDRACTVRIT